MLPHYPSSPQRTGPAATTNTTRASPATMFSNQPVTTSNNSLAFATVAGNNGNTNMYHEDPVRIIIVNGKPRYIIPTSEPTIPPATPPRP